MARGYVEACVGCLVIERFLYLIFVLSRGDMHQLEVGVGRGGWKLTRLVCLTSVHLPSEKVNALTS